MKVVELINKLNEIGYDEDTELTFGFADGNTGEWYKARFDEITYGIDLTGEPYHNDVINIDIDVDSVKEYQKYQLCIRQECCHGAFGIEKFNGRIQIAFYDNQ